MVVSLPSDEAIITKSATSSLSLPLSFLSLWVVWVRGAMNGDGDGVDGFGVDIGDGVREVGVSGGVGEEE